MNSYSIYWINEEIARYYFHRGEVLHRFFCEYNHYPYNPVLMKQFAYVTKSIPQDHLLKKLREQFHHQSAPVDEDKDHTLFGHDHVPVHVTLQNRQITFQCDMLHEAERSLFPILNNLQPFLFVSGINHDNYGWMSSPVYFKLDYPKQILYS